MKKNELKFYKKILEEKRAQLIANINSSVNEISQLRENKAADDFDVASMNTDLNIEYSLNVNQQKTFLEIESALKRIENGTYGRCECCGEFGLYAAKRELHAGDIRLFARASRSGVDRGTAGFVYGFGDFSYGFSQLCFLPHEKGDRKGSKRIRCDE